MYNTRVRELLCVVVCALPLVVGCQPAPNQCARVRGRWQGEGVDGAPALFEATLRAAMQREQWTVSATSLVRAGISEERARVISDGPERCVVELTRVGATAARVLELSVGDDTKLRATARGGATQAATIVLRRVE
jgi:hypothetical protein